MALWMIKTYMFHSGSLPQVVIHDDGSLTAEDVQLLRSHLPGARVLTDIIVCEDPTFRAWLRNFPNLFYWRFVVDHIFARKLIDFVYFSKAKYVIGCDSDVLFFKRPEQLLSGVEQSFELATQDYGDAYYPEIQLLDSCFGRTIIRRLNAGIVGMVPGRFDFQLLEEVFSRMLEKAAPVFYWKHHFVEQTLTACYFSHQKEFKLLDSEKYGISFAPISPMTEAHHFPSDESRPLFYRLGLRLLDSRGFLNEFNRRF